jgi:hypothetical protein
MEYILLYIHIFFFNLFIVYRKATDFLVDFVSCYFAEAVHGV